jgi:hypothetical protein
LTFAIFFVFARLAFAIADKVQFHKPNSPRIQLRDASLVFIDKTCKKQEQLAENLI